jgi:alpha-beta hydrolase superfamily lysophospholipase
MRIPDEEWFRTHDGTRLFYRYWPPLHGISRQAVILLHRGHEHSGRLQHLVDELELPETAMFAWDARGHGHSSRHDEAPVTLGIFVKDLDAFAQHIANAYHIPAENMAIVAHSVGSVLAAAWVHDYAPPIRCMVLASPAFQVKLYVPFARAALSVIHRLLGDFHVNSYVKPGALTHDPERIASYKADPLIQKPISVQVLLGLYDASDRIVADAQAICVPTQLLISGADWVVRRKPQLKFFDQLGSEVKEKHLFDGWYHDTLGEKDRALAIGKAREFIERMFERPSFCSPLLDADQHGYTREEFEQLRRPLPVLSFKRLKFALVRLALNTVGRLSRGIRLGIETGFDSGSTLDYVYANRSSGLGRIGKQIDRFYLNAAGWRGVRVRKRNVERALQRCLSMLRSEGQPVYVLDVAAGFGRYVLGALQHNVTSRDRILLRDYSELNVREGQALIRSKGMENVACFEKIDAFDQRALAGTWPAPTLSVVCGLYELFSDNGLLKNSLGGLAAAMQEGGYLVYTGQPWHPQLEFIARTLTSHRDGQRWIMRRRTQAELDDLVRAAGFVKLDQYIDDWGMFTVSIAKKGAVANEPRKPGVSASKLATGHDVGRAAENPIIHA